MRLLVSEFVCSGACPAEAVVPSMLSEGRAMLLAVLRDAARVPDLEVLTIWSAQRERFPVEGVAFQLAHSPDEEIELLAELAAWCDATLLIAPECDGVLTHRALLVEGVGGRLCGPNPLSISICTDKLQLAGVLAADGIATIPSHEFDITSDAASIQTYPAVVKPRDGAGSQDTFLVQSASDVVRLKDTWARSSLLRQAIWQPYVPGRALSVAVLITPEQYRYEALPPCQQHLSSNGRFEYLGGNVPAPDVDQAAVQSAAIAACRAVPGLRGYVGVDMIVPDAAPQAPMVVEINPRLTTSYLGYSKLCEHNLLARWLGSETATGELTWMSGRVEYSAEGDCRRIL